MSVRMPPGKTLAFEVQSDEDSADDTEPETQSEESSVSGKQRVTSTGKQLEGKRGLSSYAAQETLDVILAPRRGPLRKLGDAHLDVDAVSGKTKLVGARLLDYTEWRASEVPNKHAEPVRVEWP